MTYFSFPVNAWHTRIFVTSFLFLVLTLTDSSTSSAPTTVFTEIEVAFVIPSGYDSVDVGLMIKDDNWVEDNETLRASLTLISGCCLGDFSSIEIVVTDDDGN